MKARLLWVGTEKPKIIKIDRFLILTYVSCAKEAKTIFFSSVYKKCVVIAKTPVNVRLLSRPPESILESHFKSFTRVGTIIGNNRFRKVWKISNLRLTQAAAGVCGSAKASTHLGERFTPNNMHKKSLSPNFV